MTDVTVRSARDWSEVRQSAVGAGRAFEGQRPEGRFFYERILAAPALPLENTLLLFVDGTLAAALQMYERTAIITETPVKIGAIGNVFTLPEYRGEGHGSRLLAAAREFLTENGYPYSVLLSDIDEFYANAGWQVAPTTVHVVTEPPTLGGSHDGTWRAFDPETDLDALAMTYRASSGHAGRFLRPRAIWEGWVFAPEKKVLDPEQVRLYVLDGTVAGYLVRQSEDERVDCLEVGYRGPAGAADDFYAATWDALATSAPDSVAWHPPLPDRVRAGLADAGATVDETIDTHCRVQVHDERPLVALADVETTADLVTSLREGGWYWSGVDAF